jgi:ABC-type nitrate/sulfonate/bicarbonate transport system substrate-binding protein
MAFLEIVWIEGATAMLRSGRIGAMRDVEPYRAVIVNLIAATTTPTGLRVRARLDTCRYPSGLTVSREAVAVVQLRPDALHGDWN